MNQFTKTAVCLLLGFAIGVAVFAADQPDVGVTPVPEETMGHTHGHQNHSSNIQYGKVTQLGRNGAVETVWQNVIISENLECTRCRMTRLIGCLRGTCHYRCYRRCFDGNGTNWDEAIRFTMKGSR